MTNNKVNLFFKTFANCKLVGGYKRSIILDLQRETFTIIPDTMRDVIVLLNSKKAINEIISLYGTENIETISEYLDFLIEHEFGFLTDSEEFDLFVTMNETFETPSYITNCIIEVSDSNLMYLNRALEGIDNLNCKNLQFISYNEIPVDDLKHILKLTKDTNLRSIELVLKYSEEVVAFIAEIDKFNFRITELKLHNSKSKNKEIESGTFLVSFIDNELKSFKNCGVINRTFFNVNKDKVHESLSYNSCLNQKISIDKHGKIKNCPSMAESFGNIKDTTLEEAINHPDFKKYWNITKDQIAVCKDCEFRHICTDCRAYTENPDDQYSKPLKCGYSPYTNVWEEWSTNPLKQKAIEYYGMQELIKKDA